MARNFTGQPQQISNLYWQQGQPVGDPVRSLRQIKYLPLLNAVPELDQALSKAMLDCAKNFYKQHNNYNEAAKVWMTLLVKYETVNPLANKVSFVQYLSAAPTRIFGEIKQSPLSQICMSTLFEYSIIELENLMQSLSSINLVCDSPECFNLP